MQEFVKSLQKIDEAIQTWQKRSNDRYAHLDKADIDKVYKILLEKQKWYEQTASRFNSLRTHEDPKVLCSQLIQEREVNHVPELFVIPLVLFLEHGTRLLDYFE